MRTAARYIFSLAISSVALIAAATPPLIPPSMSALCPKAAPGEIVVCAELDPPKSPYRLPLPVERDPGDPRNVSVGRERNALFDHDGGGIGSCGTAGAAAGFGCRQLEFKRRVEQRAGAPDVRGWLFSKPSK